jgi:outer membrane protein OmpA-like peptidoglycan-associated protein
MEDSLLTSLVGMLDAHRVGGIAASLGASEQSISQGLKLAIAAVLGCMAFKSGDPNALRTMLDLAPSAAGDINMSQMSRAASDPSSPLISQGKRVLSGLFGNSETAVTNAVSKASGLQTSTASKVLALAAPMVMSFLSKRVRVDGMNMETLGSLLQRESGTIRNALPTALSDLFWPATVRTAPPVVAQAVEREGSSLRWLPFLALAAVIPGLFWLFSHARKPTAPQVAPITTVAPSLGTANRVAPDPVDIVKHALTKTVDLRFDTGSANLQPESQKQLDNIAATLTANPDVHTTVTGHTDNVGAAEQNLRLSQKRANSVMAELIRKGVPADHLTAEGSGLQNPIADNSNGEGRARNRRVSLDFSQH